MAEGVCRLLGVARPATPKGPGGWWEAWHGGRGWRGGGWRGGARILRKRGILIATHVSIVVIAVIARASTARAPSGSANNIMRTDAFAVIDAKPERHLAACAAGSISSILSAVPAGRSGSARPGQTASPTSRGGPDRMLQHRREPTSDLVGGKQGS